MRLLIVCTALGREVMSSYGLHFGRQSAMPTATHAAHGPCDSLGVPYLLTGRPPKNGIRCIAQRSAKYCPSLA